MKRIRGEQLYAFMGEDLTPVGASTDCSLSMSAETIEVSTRGQGRWRRFRPGKKIWSINASGFYYEQIGVPSSLLQGAQYIGENVKVAFSVLGKELAAAGFKLEAIAPDKRMTLVGEAVITACEYNGSVGGLATYSISFQGSGNLVQIT